MTADEARGIYDAARRELYAAATQHATSERRLREAQAKVYDALTEWTEIARWAAAVGARQ